MTRMVDAAVGPAQGTAELEQTIEQLRQRGLHSSVAWLIELRGSFEGDAGMSIWPPAIEVSPSSNPGNEARYLLAKSIFDCREYARCAHALEGVYEGDARATFLHFYALLFVQQRSGFDQDEALLGMTSEAKIVDPKIAEMLEELEDLCEAHGHDTYLDYLRGLLHRELKNDQIAVQAFVDSVSRNAYNWASWKELIIVCRSASEVTRIVASLPDSDMARIFRVLALTELHKSDELIDNHLDELGNTYPNNDFLKLMRALRYYTVQDYEEAEELFDGVYRRDPYRMDFIDVYSNILFVLDHRVKLSYLSKRLVAIDRHRAETCCVVGNYYSLVGEHELAVEQFRKALQLDRRYTPAWTLMGHEYVELKNTHAAIESYRHAVDYDRRDYRAWFGLGQTYEMLEMHYYALHYYEQGAALKPHDSRMWNAMAGCYDRLGRYSEAIRAIKRALAPALDRVDLGELDTDAAAALRRAPAGRSGSQRASALAAVLDAGLDPHYLIRLAGLCEKTGDVEQARRHYRIAVAVALRSTEPLQSPVTAAASSPLQPSAVAPGTAPGSSSGLNLGLGLRPTDLTASRGSTMHGNGASVPRSPAATSADSAGTNGIGHPETAAEGDAHPSAVHYMDYAERVLTGEVATACLWLARNAIRRNDLAGAERFAGLVGHLEDGRNLLKQIRALGKQHRQHRH